MRWRGRRRSRGRICTVSTVKDSLANLTEFVQRNQRGGADHMVLFVDDADPDTVAGLDLLPGVTAVPAGPGYWKGQRPKGLNPRQTINANLTNVALTLVPAVEW